MCMVTVMYTERFVQQKLQQNNFVMTNSSFVPYGVLVINLDSLEVNINRAKTVSGAHSSST